MSAIEERAEAVLAELPEFIWKRDRLPVPVEDIADSWFGLYVRDVANLRMAPGVPELATSQSLSGLLLPALGEIWVNAAEAREWPARRRFTIGHELGHWCLHRDTGTVWCRAQEVHPPEGGAALKAPYPPQESEANEFAAALLMPADLVRQHYEILRRRDPAGCFEQLCRLFRTSGAAMGRRLNRVIGSD